jgi:phospholipase C
VTELPRHERATTLTRRELLASGLVLGAGAAVRPLVGPAGRLSDIEHVVIMIQENRSFDHYFGTLRGVRGFGDRRRGSAGFRQPDGSGGHVLPFHLDTQHANAACTHDVNHDWTVQHDSWARGAMDGFVTSRLGPNGPDAPLTMGYYDRRDLAYYYALAQAFTICDMYFCSAMGPTDPNRLHAMTATIDPSGKAGGPVVASAGSPRQPPRLHWTTMPEQLESRRISWKVYASPDATNLDGDNTLLFFEQYHRDAALGAKALTPTFPADFEADVAAGALPQVAWLISPVLQLEHPAQSPPAYGEYAVSRMLAALWGRPELWARTAVFVTWDENGGFFDHVKPPTPPRGTKGEYLTGALPPEAGGVRGPIGLGARVPTLVLSPFSRGGFVCSDVFDHTSLLRFLETRFGAEVPNLSRWRRKTVGDLTTAFDFARPDPSIPGLPPTSLDDPLVQRECAMPITSYPKARRVPPQEHGRARRPSGPVGRRRGRAGSVGGASTLLAAGGLVVALRNRDHGAAPSPGLEAQQDGGDG